jgi:hypothetical protein
MYVLQASRLGDVEDFLDFLWVDLDTSHRDNEAKLFSGWDPKQTLGRVQLHVKFSEIHKGFHQVGDEVIFLSGYHRYVVHVGVVVTTYLVM